MKTAQHINLHNLFLLKSEINLSTQVEYGHLRESSVQVERLYNVVHIITVVIKNLTSLHPLQPFSIKE